MPVLFVLSLFGLIETLYLIRCRIKKSTPICLSDETCRLVLRSKYSKLFGVHNDVLGLLFYLAIIVLSGALFLNLGPADLELLGLHILLPCGAIMSVALTYIQARILHAWCMWCLLSAATNWAMVIYFFS